MIMGVLFISLLILLLLNIPIAASLAISCTLAMVFGDINVPLTVVSQRMFTAVDSFPYMAVPFFLLAGNLMSEGGISRRLINLARNLVGMLPGGLGIVTIVASAFFGAISGSNAATVAAIGGIMVPEMEKDEYPKDFACATAAAAGTLGVVVPPSVPMVTYGVISGVSIGTLFIAGFMPALCMMLAMGAVMVVQARKLKIKPIKVSAKELARSFKEAIPALMMPVIILGGIYGGIFTPTEAAAVACVYSLVVTMIFFREINLKSLVDIMYESGKTTGVIFFIIACSNSFVWLLTSQRIPEVISSSILSISDNRYVIMLLINVLLLILGIFLETNAIILLVTPMMLPIALAIGVDPLLLGIILVVNTSVGMITPPMALNIIVASGVGNLSIEAVAKKIVPYLVVLIGVILLITYVPEIVFMLPRAFGKM